VGKKECSPWFQNDSRLKCRFFVPVVQVGGLHYYQTMLEPIAADGPILPLLPQSAPKSPVDGFSVGGSRDDSTVSLTQRMRDV
jgi:hypothetical protein